MNDVILAARIEALKRDLEWVGKGRDWLEKKLNPKPNELTDQLWGALGATIRTEAEALTDDLEEICRNVEEGAKDGADEAQQSLRDAWLRYAEAYQQSRRIFGEYLDFIGGLALRYQGMDERICCIADELIRKCSLEGTGSTWNSLTVIAAKESFSRTMARIIRLRFPEWTIWALPFTAHEYGHVVLDETEKIKKILGVEVENLAKEDEGYNAANDDQARERIKERIRKHVFVLFADAFATFMMGPAYACAAIFLRFDPSNACVETAEMPSDNLRVLLMFKILRRMNREASDEITPIYTPVINILEREWRQMLERAGAMEAILEAERQDAEEQEAEKQRVAKWRRYERIWEALNPPNLLREARYPHEGEKEGWQKAEKWAKELQEVLDKKRKDIQPLSTDKLRDVLNAAWRCRLKVGKPGQIEYIAEAAVNLCHEIIKLQHVSPQGRRSSRSVKAPPLGS
jgi:hypothetical protein